MSKIQTVWVYADAAERYADLIAGARRFGAVVNAVVPCESCAAELRACGPAAVYNLGLAEGEAIENYAETIASLAQGEGNLFLFDATRRSKALAAGVAAKRGAGLVNDALSLEAGDAVKASKADAASSAFRRRCGRNTVRSKIQKMPVMTVKIKRISAKFMALNGFVLPCPIAFLFVYRNSQTSSALTPSFLSIAYYFSSTSKIARKASCGISTLPTCFIRFLPAFCFSSSLRLRVMSPP